MEINDRIDLVSDHISPVADNGTLCSQQIPFWLAHSGNIGMDEFRLLTPGKSYLYPLLVRVGDVMPNTVLASGDNSCSPAPGSGLPPNPSNERPNHMWCLLRLHHGNASTHRDG